MTRRRSKSRSAIGGGVMARRAMADALESRLLLSGGLVFVVNEVAGTIGEYTSAGATVNASLISGLPDPIGVAISGSDLFVANGSAGTIGEYTTSGATVNASLVSGLNNPSGIAISGSDLFVTNNGAGDTGTTLGEYT